MAKTVKDVKDKIIDYLYNVDFEKMTVAEMNALNNATIILKGVSEIRETTDEPWAKALASIYDKGIFNGKDTSDNETVYGIAKVGE